MAGAREDSVLYYRVPNWDRYQSYPGRRMVWFKFYVDLADDEDFFKLSESERLHVMSVWMMATKTENRIPASQPRFVQRYNLADEPLDLEALCEAGWLELIEEETALIAGEKHLTIKSEPSVDRVVPLEKRREEKTEKKNVADKTPATDAVREIYDHWRTARRKTDRRFAKISEGRRRKIQSRLREFSAVELMRAIDCVALDPWEERPRHDDLTVIFRSQEQVDRFLSFWKEKPAPPCAECGIGGGQHLAECSVVRVA
jgi:hypothetical protein